MSGMVKDITTFTPSYLHIVLPVVFFAVSWYDDNFSCNLDMWILNPRSIGSLYQFLHRFQFIYDLDSGCSCHTIMKQDLPVLPLSHIHSLLSSMWLDGWPVERPCSRPATGLVSLNNNNHPTLSGGWLLHINLSFHTWYFECVNLSCYWLML